MIINHEGQSYEIENWDEFKGQILNDIGLQVVMKVEENIMAMDLRGKSAKQRNSDNRSVSQLKGSIQMGVVGGELVVTSDATHAPYLEFGTYEYYMNYGKQNFPETPHKKKMYMTSKEKTAYPMGGQPFAMFRRVLYNPQVMGKIINNAFRGASK
jgi:hypothetical protein